MPSCGILVEEEVPHVVRGEQFPDLQGVRGTGAWSGFSVCWRGLLVRARSQEVSWAAGIGRER